MAEYQSTKHIVISAESLNTDNKSSHPKHPNPKIPRKKIGSQTDHWILTSQTYSTQESQIQLIRELMATLTLSSAPDKDKNDAANILLTHLKTKQSGYRSQDTVKKFYDPERFVQIPDIVALLIESNLSCFYCQKWATLFYENVRDPRQWSLERLSNDEGHNRENVVIAC